MRRCILLFALALPLLGCNDVSVADNESSNIASSCTAEETERVAHSVARDLLARIEQLQTRQAACDELDEILKQGDGHEAFEISGPGGCEWDWTGSNGPSEIVIESLEPEAQSMSVLCDWPARQAKARRENMESRGRAVLNSLPAEEREQIEREWNNYTEQ